MATSAPPPTVLTTGSPIKELVADGDRAAAVLDHTASACDRVLVWSPVDSTSVRKSGSLAPGPCDSSTGSGIYHLALADRSLAWIDYAGGNFRDLTLSTLTLGDARSSEVDFAEYELGSAREPSWQVHGHGSLLAFADEGRLWRIVGLGGRDCPNGRLPTDPAPSTQLCVALTLRGRLLWVDSGRLLAIGENGSLVLRRPDGRMVPIDVDATRVAAARLQGRDLVLLLRSGDLNSLALFDATGGTIVRTFPLGTRTRVSGPGDCGGPVRYPFPCSMIPLRLEDVQNGIAVYVARDVVRLVRLADGAQIAIHPPGAGPVHAQLEAAGLYYSYAVPGNPKPGRIAFVPFADVVARFATSPG